MARLFDGRICRGREFWLLSEDNTKASMYTQCFWKNRISGYTVSLNSCWPPFGFPNLKVQVYGCSGRVELSYFDSRPSSSISGSLLIVMLSMIFKILPTSSKLSPSFSSSLLPSSRLDYGNSTLAGVSSHLLSRLQSVMNAAARLIFSSSRAYYNSNCCTSKTYVIMFHNLYSQSAMSAIL